MKLYAKLSGLLLIVALAFSSCSKDDDVKPIIPGPPVGVEIRYRVTASADIITQINYSMGGGTTFSGSPDPENHMLWEKSLVALYTQMPSTAFLEVKCINPTTENQTCTLSFYNGSTLLATKTGTIPPATTTAVTTQLSEIVDIPPP